MPFEMPSRMPSARSRSSFDMVPAEGRCQGYMELIFVTLGHTFPVSACALVCSRECRSCFDDFVSNRHGSGPVAASLWWRSPPDISSVTFDHDVLCKLPSLWGRRVAYSVDPVTARAGPLL